MKLAVPVLARRRATFLAPVDLAGNFLASFRSVERDVFLHPVVVEPTKVVRAPRAGAAFHRALRFRIVLFPGDCRFYCGKLLSFPPLHIVRAAKPVCAMRAFAAFHLA